MMLQNCAHNDKAENWGGKGGELEWRWRKRARFLQLQKVFPGREGETENRDTPEARNLPIRISGTSDSDQTGSLV